MRKFSKLMNPKATLLTLFNRLFTPSVGPLEIRAWCQAVIWSNQLPSVWASLRSSGGDDLFEHCSMMSRNRSVACSAFGVS